MGWKQDNLYLVLPARRELSENQCGMETRLSLLPPRVQQRVEREPMWDGNLTGALSNQSISSPLSENQCGMETLIGVLAGAVYTTS